MIAKKKRVSRNFVAKWTKAPTQDFTNEKYSPENLARMRKGLAPKSKLGESKELHHKYGRDILDPHNPKYLEEVWPRQHEKIDPFRYLGE
jgi:predicted Rossmann fold nucleotide-binding protein DprA/Smf involved in DNA uptake